MNKNSRSETKFRIEALRRGFKLFSKGWPDYIIEKDGKYIFVECKRPIKRFTKQLGFSKHQLEIKEILQKLGLNYKVYREDFGVIEKQNG